MKKYLTIAAVLVGQLFAMDGVPALVCFDTSGESAVTRRFQEFLDANGLTRAFHFASAEEINAIPNSARISPVGKGMHAPRASVNQVRIVKFDDDSFMFAGRIVYGVQPYSSEAPEERLSLLLDFFRGVADVCGIEDLSDTQVGNVNWINPVHAATVVMDSTIPELGVFNTFSFYEAAAELIRESNADLAANNVIPTVDKPFFLLSYCQTKPVGDESAKSIAVELPINDGTDGWRWAVFARIDGQEIPPLPEALTDLVIAYRQTQIL